MHETLIKKVVWNLNEFYHHPDDPQIQKEIKGCLEFADHFENRFKGRVNDLDTDDLYAALVCLEELNHTVLKLSAYARLYHVTHIGDTAASHLLKSSEQLKTDIQKKTYFFIWEWSRQNAEESSTNINTSIISRFKRYLASLLSLKDHLVSPPENDILSDWFKMNRVAEGLFYDTLINNLASEGQRIDISEERHNLQDPRQNIRQKAEARIFGGLLKASPAFVHILNTQVLVKHKIDTYTHHLDWLGASNAANGLDRQTTQILLDEVSRHRDVVKNYLIYKKKSLGLTSLYAHDIFCPLQKVSVKKHGWEEASYLLISAFNAFSPALGKIAAKFFGEKWIHASPQPDKASGAFTHIGTTDSHPYIFLNFKGTRRDLFLLAHELGHGIHYYLSRHNGPLSAKPPLPAQELAAIFSELLLFEYLYRNAHATEDKRNLLSGFLEDMILTVFRQAGLHCFESELHQRIPIKGALRKSDISALWIKSQTQSYASQVIFTETNSLDWALVPHFFHAPGYVRIYALSALMALSMAKNRATESASFKNRYMRFLEMGHHCKLYNLLAVLGLDLNSADTLFSQGFSFLAEKQMMLEGLEVPFAP